MGRYIVQRGDTLSGIARRLGVNWRTLYNQNKPVIGNSPNYIRTGWALQLPGAPRPTMPPRAAVARPVAPRPAPFKPFNEYLATDIGAATERAKREAIQEYARPKELGFRDLLNNFADRNLLRSGDRATAETDLTNQFKRNENTLEQQLLNSALAELQGRYDIDRRAYERRLQGQLTPNFGNYLS